MSTKTEGKKKVIKFKPKGQKKPRKKKAQEVKKPDYKILTFERKDIEDALAVAMDFVPKSELVIMKSVHIKAGGGEATITVTDLSNTYRKRIPCKGDTISRCIPAHLLFKEIKALHSDVTKVELHFHEKTVIVNGRCEICTDSAREYPTVKDYEGEKVYIDDLAHKLKRVVVAADRNPHMQPYNGVLIDLPKGYILASDRHRIHFDTYEKVETSKKVIIPGAIAQLAAKHTVSNEVRIGDEVLMFELAGGTLTTMLLQGDYADYESYIPKNLPITITFHGSEFLKTMEGVMPLLENEYNNLIKMTFNGRMEIETKRENVGNYKYFIPCTIEGKKEDNINIHFNARYVIDAVKAYTTRDNDVATLKMSTPKAACLINEKALVMPVNIGEEKENADD